VHGNRINPKGTNPTVTTAHALLLKQSLLADGLPNNKNSVCPCCTAAAAPVAVGGGLLPAVHASLPYGKEVYFVPLLIPK